MKQPIHSTAAVGRRTPRLDIRGGVRTSKNFEFMVSFRTALLATAASALSLAAALALLAAPLRRLASFGPVLLILALPLLMRGLSALISTEKLSLLTARITQALLVLCNLPGYRVVPKGTSPGRGGRDLSYGTIRRFQLQPTGGAPALALLLVPVRGRNSEHPVQMAKLPAVLPEFALSQRQLRGLDRADSIAPPPRATGLRQGPGGSARGHHPPPDLHHPRGEERRDGADTGPPTESRARRRPFPLPPNHQVETTHRPDS